MFYHIILCFLFAVNTYGVQGILIRREQIVKFGVRSFNNDNCDQSSIPVMESFNIEQFAGDWYELAKSVSGYIDVDDGMWKIDASDESTTFFYSGRDNNRHCIRPIKGRISTSPEPPGLLTLHYNTYATHVKESIRVLFTDYKSIAVVYTCMYHMRENIGLCHPGGIFGAIWTRKPHVDLDVYENAVKYLEMACLPRTALRIRTIESPCNVDSLGFRENDFPAPAYCYDPMDMGSCSRNLSRYFYDPRERTCRQFLYGGCGGNQNNFLSVINCKERCISALSKEPICMAEAACGIHCSPCCTENNNGCIECSCEKIIIDDFYNCQKDASCPSGCKHKEPYSGCHICECNDHIKEDKISVFSNARAACIEVKETGKCSEEIERFYYNAIAERCQKFIYSGCKGNRNNFDTLEECSEKCENKEGVKRKSITYNNSVSKSMMPNINIILMAMFAVRAFMFK